jgi:hypothetical protein
MTRRVSKHGTTYTQGSTTTFAGWEPKRCWVCGGAIVKARSREMGGLGFYFDDITGAVFSWHGNCASGPPSSGAKDAA